jgi:valyl-tRNA synthetase
MVMMGLQLTDTLPFSTVYLHAMVRDKYGRKMSKSLGNVIDPLEVINACPLADLLSKIDEGNLPASEVEKAKEIMKKDFPSGIAECGTDALRFGMLAYTIQGRDINLDILRVVGYRQFCNKVWNASRFALTYVSDFVPESYSNTRNICKLPDVSTRDLFILSKLNNLIRECNVNLGDYLFGAVTSALHSFFMYDLCDNYLEFTKPIFKDDSPENANRKRAAQATLYAALETFLRLSHPIMPFVTEELWQRLPNRSSLTTIDSIMISPYPESFEEWSRPDIEANMEVVKEAIHVARSIRTDYKIANHVKPHFFYRHTGPNNFFQDASLRLDFCTLARGESLSEIASDLPAPKSCCVKVINDQISLLIDLTGIIDVDIELARLTKEVERLQPIIENYKKKINATDYAKVPEKVRLDNTEKLAAYDAELQATLSAKAMFEAMK